MKKINRFALMVIIAHLGCSAPVLAAAGSPGSTMTEGENYGDVYGDSYGYGRGRNLGFLGVLADLILLRPVGLAMTVGGAGLLVATSPFTGIASIAPPHDSFVRAGNALVVGPAGFTFNRPLGEFSYQRSGVYPVLTRPSDIPVQVPVPVVTRTTAPPSVAPATPQKPLYKYSPDRLEYPANPQEETYGRVLPPNR
jgi:hypothetical protein